ncbi:hypothetical protein TNIN_309081 [Trichonephila inaurata madagascariensis]|uniref:Uncharacterized protein n=1 Tax=Trichonephila inaurata madagascariensis TaxID=2747483 RepID=A0A8X6WPT7_9ARAC|nr:hypothetical protein TNIN_309081 [Trichonephila inaurata madagascariensis]
MTTRPSRRDHKASPMKASNGHYGKLMAQMARKECQRAFEGRLKLKDCFPILGSESMFGGIYGKSCYNGSRKAFVYVQLKC